eukprot:2371113-Pyramimonas_sp.AAC.1
MPPCWAGVQALASARPSRGRFIAKPWQRGRTRPLRSNSTGSPLKYSSTWQGQAPANSMILQSQLQIHFAAANCLYHSALCRASATNRNLVLLSASATRANAPASKCCDSNSMKRLSSARTSSKVARLH